MVTELTKSMLIEWISPELLNPHPFNIKVYGDEPCSPDMVESIKNVGVLDAIYVTPERRIISGHRRARAACEAGVGTVPVITVTYQSDLEEQQAIIEFNRQRIKNGWQQHNEGTELKRIFAEQARLRQATSTGGVNPQLTETFREAVKDLPEDRHERETATKVAEAIGLGSGKQWDKLEFIAEHKPELLTTINGKQGKSINSAYVSARREVVKEEVKTTEIPTGMYRVIYADPPWRYGNTQPDYHEVQDDHYPTMTVKQICDLLIGERRVAEIALDNAVLFLWVTSPILEESFEVIKAWGFKYKASFVWDKVKHNMGHYNSVRHEFLLIGVRGSCQPDENQLFDSVQSIERTEHSAKPEEFRNIIQTLYPYGTRIELFARQEHEGWDYFGNQITAKIS
jgi:N6-adenosine-specific RNA methylase IME4